MRVGADVPVVGPGAIVAGLEQGGFTQDELKEVLMQTAIYAGVPAANTAFTETAEVIAELAEV